MKDKNGAHLDSLVWDKEFSQLFFLADVNCARYVSTVVLVTESAVDDMELVDLR